MTEHDQPSPRRAVTARVVRGISRIAAVVAVGALLVFAGIVLAHLPAWVAPPHYPPGSPAYTPPFSSHGVAPSIPSNGWFALGVAVVAVSVSSAIARWSATDRRTTG